MTVDFSSFSRAIGRLEEAFTAYMAEPENTFIRDAVVIRFLFTYELSQTTLRRFLDEYSVNWKAMSLNTTPDLIRTANQDGLLLSEWEVWHEYRQARNRLSHTYEEDEAKAVLNVIPDFISEVRFLHSRLEAYPQ
jgi:nucleotidyltransferase substrate binding protein (TIGR01987 family)